MRSCVILAFTAIALPALSRAEPPRAHAPRPAIAVWAEELQATFARLPHASGTPDPNLTSPESTCDRSRAVFESARGHLFPTPTAELDDAFTEYIDALLVLYGECPKDPQRALMLHDRANRLGSRFESLVNRALDREATRRARPADHPASAGI